MFRPKASATNARELDSRVETPAANVSMRCSTINADDRQRVAPTDARIAISRARPADRARSRSATFTQAMSRTNAACDEREGRTDPGAGRLPSTEGRYHWLDILVGLRVCLRERVATRASRLGLRRADAWGEQSEDAETALSRRCVSTPGMSASGSDSSWRNGNSKLSAMTLITVTGCR